MADRARGTGTGEVKRSLVRKKVCMLGDFGVGKSSLVRQFVYGRFDERYQATIGVHIKGKAVTVPGRRRPTEVQMALWDLAGSKDLDKDPLRHTYLRGSHGALLVCDLTRRETLERLERYAADLSTVNVEATVVVAANKGDLDPEHLKVSEAEVAAMASRLDAAWFITSAKDGKNVDSAFTMLAAMMVGEA